jgi:hypothetical protein
LKKLEKRVKEVEESGEEKELNNERFVQKEVEVMKQSFKGIVKEREEEREKDIEIKDKGMQLKMIELMEREKRRNNLIIRGIKETGKMSRNRLTQFWRC